MDDTQQSRASEAASRKRRSSILKSQRPPRTPFCELEFNVTTPPDTTKSRRVSFSRRTGVAEFATNEATTTWKNFYEEHNKSLESSGNDSGANGTKQTVGHLGKRLFDEQFEEVEVFDFTERPGINVSNSINNVNFTLQCTDKLPPSNFELSAFTEQQSKVFEDDLAVPSMREVSDHIDINFSTVQTGEKDDLDEIQQDIQRQSNCHGAFNDRQNMSEYIEVDLDMTHVAIRQDESDMSITDMIHAPKVQDVSKSCSIDKKVNLEKENIAMNPFVAPRESLNFAINEDPDNVLVFDGKKLIVQSEKPKTEIPEKAQRKTIVLNCDDDLPNFVDNSKNASGFVEMKLGNNKSNQDKSQNKQTTILYDDDSCNISITKAAYPNELSLRRRTVLYDNDANISVTQAVPVNIIENKTKSVIYESENGNISVTKALSGVILSNENKLNENTVFNANKIKEKTIVYKDDTGDISVAQALPPNIISEKRKTIHCEDNAGNVSVTQAIPNIVIKDNAKEKRRTIVYEKDTGNISVTQVISTNVILIENTAPERRRTVVFENDNGNISVTQAIPTNIIMPVLKTPVESNFNISMTQAVPANILMGENSMKVEKSRSVIYNNETGDISVTQAVANKIFIEEKKIENQNNQTKRRTVLFDNEDGDISVTQAVPIKIFTEEEKLSKNIANIQYNQTKRRMVLFDNEDGNISVTQAVPNKIFSEEENTANKGNVQNNQTKRRTVLFDNENADISVTQAIPNKIFTEEEKTSKNIDNVQNNQIKRRTVLFDNEDGNISVTQAVPNKIFTEEEKMSMNIDNVQNNQTKRRTVLFDNEDGNISVTQAIPNKIFIEEEKTSKNIDNVQNNQIKRRTVLFDNDDGNISVTQAVPNMIFNKGEKTLKNMDNIKNNQTKRRTVLFDNDDGNISVTQAVPNKIFSEEENTANKGNVQNNQIKRRTVLFDNENADISVTQAIPNKIFTEEEKTANNIDNVQNNQTKRRTVLFDNEDGNISVTQEVNLNKLLSSMNMQDNSNKKSVDNTEKNCATVIYNKTVNVTEAVSVETIIKEEQDKTKRRTIVFENENADISMTAAVNVNQLLSALTKQEDNEAKNVKKRGTIMYEDDDANISITQAIPANILPKEKRQSVFFDNNDISMTQAIPAHIIAENKSLFMEIDNITNDSQQKLEISTDLKEPPKGLEISTQDISRKISINTSCILNEAERAVKSELCKSFEKKNDTLKSVNDILVYQAVTLNQNEVKDCKSDYKSQDVSMEEVAMSTDINEDILESKASNSIHENHISMSSLQRNEGISTASYPMSTTKSSATTMGDLNTVEKLSEQQEHVKDVNTSAENVDVKDVTLSTKLPSEPALVKFETTSNDSLFYITNDKPEHLISNKSSIEQKSVETVEGNDNIQKQLSEIKTSLSEQTSYRQSEESSSPINKTLGSSIMDILKKGVHHYKRKKSFKSANDTDELLGMLSDFSDIPHSKSINENLAGEEQGDILTQDKPVVEDIKALQENEKPSGEDDIPLEEDGKSATFKNPLAIEDKSEELVPKNKEIEPKINIQRRISVALSREDLLNNISMAAAALQKSRMEFDDSNNIDTSKETPDEEMSPKKTVRMSSAVVKTLNFDEETSDVIITDTNLASLKKTAFGEISYMKEAKNRVIPDYTMDMSLGVKELMDDLVKPMADVLPYDASGVDKNSRKVPSTCSTQIQANLITSSQVDLTSGELTSHPESVEDFNKLSSSHIISEAVQRSVTRAMKSPISTRFDTTPSFKSFDTDTISEDKPATSRPCEVEQQGHVLIFDQNNPLNNILLAPPGPVEVHKYNPNLSGESSLSPDRHSNQDVNSDQVAQYCLSKSLKMRSYSGSESGILSNVSQSQSVSRAIEAKNDTAHAEVNTVIAMKGNKELLDASSSLTLVDEAFAPSECDVPMKKESPVKSRNQSPVRVIYKVLENEPEKLDSDLTSNDEQESLHRAKKRMYSPAQKDHKMFTKSELTPKPVSKMQRTSSTPENKDKTEYMDLTKSPPEKDESRKRSPKKIKCKKPGATITVQQLLTEYNVRDIDHESLKTQIREALDSDGSSLDLESRKLGVSAVMISSCSSKNMRDESISQEASEKSSLPSEKSSRNWGPDEDYFKKTVVAENDSGVNVVAKIDMLPFMGSPECEWESSSGDTWSFRLLHARLRLVVRLEHRHDNAARTIVRADTRVLYLDLETIREEKDPLAHLCVQFALGTMRWALPTHSINAGELPRVLRRLAAAARAAARWTRAMHRSRLRLAYTVNRDGGLALNVANIPLRSVWQITMKIELCTDPNITPYPRATDVNVTRILADCCVTVADTQRLLAHCSPDWTHAPAAIWKIFRYLKHKTHDDNLFNL